MSSRGGSEAEGRAPLEAADELQSSFGLLNEAE
jgi:hypothetical protein